MTQNELSAVVKGIGAAVFLQLSKSLEQSLEAFEARITAMEQRVASVRDGADGLPGQPGEAGPTGPAGADGVAGEPGRDADEARVVVLEAEVKALRDEIVTLKMQPVVVPDVELPDVQALVKGAVAEAVAQIQVKDGKDGIGLLGVLIDRDHHLVVTLSDGTVKDVGLVVGRDGRDVDMDAVRQTLDKAIADIPVPKDGAPGKDGIDGVGFDDLSLELDEARGYVVRFVRGEVVKDFPVAIPNYKGLFTQGQSYQPGAVVTWANSGWIALRETGDVPGTGPGPQTGWAMLASGVRGKTGPVGPGGPRGEKGDKGEPGPIRWS